MPGIRDPISVKLRAAPIHLDISPAVLLEPLRLLTYIPHLNGQAGSMETYRVRVSKDYLGFCAAHFIIFRKSQCERLHGHNYRVAAELEGTLDENYLVFDFIELKQILMTICQELDHRMLVPVKSEQISIEVGEASVSMRFEDREWAFPRTDCVLLPIENTTAEQLAHYFAHRLADALRERAAEAAAGVPAATRTGIHKVTIEMYEGPGQSATYSMGFRPDSAAT